MKGREQALEGGFSAQAAEGSGGLDAHLGVGVGQGSLEGWQVPGLLHTLDDLGQAGCSSLAHVELRIIQRGGEWGEGIDPTQPAEGIQRGTANGRIGMLQGRVEGGDGSRIGQAIEHLADGLGGSLAQRRICFF